MGSDASVVRQEGLGDLLFQYCGIEICGQSLQTLLHLGKLDNALFGFGMKIIEDRRSLLPAGLNQQFFVLP